MSSTYSLPVHDTLLTHFPALSTHWLHDVEDNELQVDAWVASGDYFSTLATTLDRLAQLLPMNSAEQTEVEQLVDTLLYLDRRYAIIPKPKIG